MITVLSPSKTLDFQSRAPMAATTTPHFVSPANYLAKQLALLRPAQLGELLNISSMLAQLNADRYATWKEAAAKQAIFAYNGDVYQGMDASSLSTSEIGFAQDRLRIFSGMYGMLRPLDAIKPYRIDMGTPFSTPKATNLYEYWSERITIELNKCLRATSSTVLINLASQEYFAAVDKEKLIVPVISPVFKDMSNGEYAIISTFAKRARGMMARFIIQHQITDHEMLVGFDEGGYNFNHGLSSDGNWVFTRG